MLRLKMGGGGEGGKITQWGIEGRKGFTAWDLP